jgi:hypothetical protein
MSDEGVHGAVLRAVDQRLPDRGKKLKEGEVCNEFPQGGEEVVRTTGVLSGCN